MSRAAASSHIVAYLLIMQTKLQRDPFPNCVASRPHIPIPVPLRHGFPAPETPNKILPQVMLRGLEAGTSSKQT